MIECTNYKSFQKGYLQGFADLYVEKFGLEFFGVPLYMKDGKRWINFPSKEYKNEQGEKKFMPYYRFRDKAHYTAFCEQAKDAIDKWCKESAPRETPQENQQNFFNENNEEIPF